MTTSKFNELLDAFVAKVNDWFVCDYSRSETPFFYEVITHESFITKEVFSLMPPSLLKLLSVDLVDDNVVLCFAKRDLK